MINLFLALYIAGSAFFALDHATSGEFVGAVIMAVFCANAMMGLLIRICFK